MVTQHQLNSHKKETNEYFQKLGEDMKTWAVEKMVEFDSSIITLPIGMLYPVNVNNEIKVEFCTKWLIYLKRKKKLS